MGSIEDRTSQSDDTQEIGPSGKAHWTRETNTRSNHGMSDRSAKRLRQSTKTTGETREQLLDRLLNPTLTLEEAAHVLDVCPTTVRRYTNRGILPHFRTTGNQRRFRLSHVLAFLDSQGNGESLEGVAEFTPMQLAVPRDGQQKYGDTSQEL